MKFGFRTPSLNKRLAARFSVKRAIRHNLGFKASRVMGWITNPQKALYNRKYTRSTASIDELLSNGSKKRKRNQAPERKSSTSNNTQPHENLFIYACILIITGLVLGIQAKLIFLLLLGLFVFLFFRAIVGSSKKTSTPKTTVASHTSSLYPESGQLWVGATPEMVIANFGTPAEIEEKIVNNKKRVIFKYFKFGGKYDNYHYYALRIAIDNGFVTEWDDKRSWAPKQ